MASNSASMASMARMARSLARLASFDVAFVRHANAGPAPADLARQLTPAGVAQAAAAAAGFMKKLPAPLAPFALTSPAQRSVDTAGLVLSGSDPRPELQPVDVLYDAMLQPGAGEAFDRIGYAPVAAYLADAEGEAFQSLLVEHGEHVVQAIGAAATVSSALRGGVPLADGERRTICVFGHAMYLNAAALHLAGLRGHGPVCIEALLREDCQEASGFWVGERSSEVLRAQG